MIHIKKSITIRTANTKDVDLLADWWSSGKIMAHAGFPKGLKVDRVKLAKRIKDFNIKIEPKFEILIIEENGRPIGEMNYRFKREGVYEIGIKICDFTKHNQGIGTMVMKLLFDFLFQNRNAKKIILDTNLSNNGAQRFYERLGLKKIRTMINSWVNQVGEIQSTVEYELDKESFYSKE